MSYTTTISIRIFVRYPLRYVACIIFAIPFGMCELIGSIRCVCVYFSRTIDKACTVSSLQIQLCAIPIRLSHAFTNNALCFDSMISHICYFQFDTYQTLHNLSKRMFNFISYPSSCMPFAILSFKAEDWTIVKVQQRERKIAYPFAIKTWKIHWPFPSPSNQYKSLEEEKKERKIYMWKI